MIKLQICAAYEDRMSSFLVVRGLFFIVTVELESVPDCPYRILLYGIILSDSDDAVDDLLCKMDRAQFGAMTTLHALDGSSSYSRVYRDESHMFNVK